MTFTFNAGPLLREAANELRQMHSHYQKDCTGGCPTLDIVTRIEERIQDQVAIVRIPHRTEAELDQLKANWKADPCWDIETTEGFEAYRTELLIFRLRQEIVWLEERMKPLTELRETLRKVLGIAAIESRLNECFPEVH